MQVQEAPPTKEQVLEGLKVVTDPEIGINVVDLGLVYDVEVSPEGEIKITYTLTSLGCPAGAEIEAELKEVAASYEGVTSVTMKLTMQPPWGPDKMSDFAKSALGFF
ncbi:MAG TPA: metal-sulfur cluster assembly factor [Actinomycetota bacterium]|nr:metal-sulfur cluster assembly factor [Actinomycetota bacterium]